MFEARLLQGSVLKKVIDAIKDLITDANFDCSSTGFSLQAMDSSHVALVALLLRSEGFDHFRCDRALSMGFNIANMAKILKCASSDDIITIKADDGTDNVTFMFESPSQEKISDIDMKLMDIDSEHLGIPDAEYNVIVKMPASEFSTICSNLATIGDTVTISVSKQGVTFSTKGDIGTGKITCRPNTSTENPQEATIIEMKETVMLTFALKYITTFTKATSLSNQVTISLSSDMPMVVEYKVAEMGYIRYYLAPKLEEDELEANPEAQTGPQMGTQEAIPITIVDSKEEDAENVEDSKVKMETEPEADVKPKVERSVKEKCEAVDGEFKMETETEEEKQPKMEGNGTKAEAEVMEVE